MTDKSTRQKPALRPRFRVMCGENIALGPGKVELLALLVETSSLNESARRLEMSYMRAWKLVNTINECFLTPVLVAERGGKDGGGMKVTETGLRALALYREIESSALKSSALPWGKLKKMLRP